MGLPRRSVLVTVPPEFEMRHFLSLVAVAIALARPVALGYPRGIHRSKVLLSARDVDESYDYVIVGGGTAGLTVADRLTEDGETTVLVVENGILSMTTHALQARIRAMLTLGG